MRSLPTSLAQRFLQVPNWLYACIACLVIGVYFATLTPANDDFKIYYQAAVSIAHAGEPYSQAPAYIYPPLLAYLVRPLTVLPPFRAQQLWFIGNVLLLGVFCVLCMWHVAPAALRQRWGLMSLAVVLAPPTRVCLQLGQLGILIAVLLVAVYVLERRTPLAALCLALACLLKLYPALLGLLALRRRAWPLVLWTLLAAIGMVGLSVVGYGLWPYLYYLSNPFPKSAFPAEAEFNVSLYGLWFRLLTANNYTISVAQLPVLAAVLTGVTTLAVLGTSLWATSLGEGILYHQTLHSLWLTTMLLVSPINGYYNLVLLLVPLLTIGRHLTAKPTRALRLWCIFATALVCIPPGWTGNVPWLYDALHARWGISLLTPSLYGLLIYLVILVKLGRASTPHLAGCPNTALSPAALPGPFRQ